jgi:hypothetical protein
MNSKLFFFWFKKQIIFNIINSIGGRLSQRSIRGI